MYMPLMVDLKRVVIFGGERGEGRQKCEKLACYADELLVVPEGPGRGSAIDLTPGALPNVAERLALPGPRRIPVAAEPAAPENIERFIAGATFVVSDLLDRALNERIAGVCRERGILCNVIDTKDLCTVWFMSLIDTGHLVAAISSKGGCAYYAKRTRVELEAEFEHREPAAAILSDARARIPPGVDRTSVLDRIYRDDAFGRYSAAGQWDAARARAEEILAEECPSGVRPGSEPAADSAAGDRHRAPGDGAKEASWQESSTI